MLSASCQNRFRCFELVCRTSITNIDDGAGDSHFHFLFAMKKRLVALYALSLGLSSRNRCARESHDQIMRSLQVAVGRSIGLLDITMLWTTEIKLQTFASGDENGYWLDSISLFVCRPCSLSPHGHTQHQMPSARKPTETDTESQKFNNILFSALTRLKTFA